MHRLSALTIRTRLFAIVVITALGLAGVAAIAALQDHARIMSERKAATASVVQTALAVVQFGALGPVIALTAALAGAQIFVGNFLEPYLMGNSLNLSPFVILVSLVVWSAMWGLPGAILSVPITAILVIVLSEFKRTRPIAILLSRDGEITSSATGDGAGA